MKVIYLQMLKNLRGRRSFKQNIHFGKVLLALIIAITSISGSVGIVYAEPATKTMEVTFEESTTERRSKVVNIPNLKEIVNITTNTGSVAHSVSGYDVTVNVNGGSSRTQDRKEIKNGYRDGQIRIKGWTVGKPSPTMTVTIPDNFFFSSGYPNHLPSNRTPMSEKISVPLTSQEQREDGIIWDYTYDTSATYNFTYEEIITINYYSYTVTIEYIDNSDPTIAIKSPNENSYFGKEGSINLQGSVKDTDSGDILSIKYTIDRISAHTNKTLSPTLTANGNNQSFTRAIPIDSSIPQGDHILKVWVEDNKGGKSSEVIRTIKIDKTAPITPIPVINVNSSNKITVEATPKDVDSGVNSILWNRNGRDLDSWIKENILVDNNLTPNKKYTYKYKATDNVDNISKYSEGISKHTLALYPTQIKLNDYTSTIVTLDILNNVENESIPENKIILREKDTDIIIATSEWIKDETITLTGLEADKSYEVLLNTRNEDKVENGEVKLPSKEFNIKLVDSEGNEIDEILTNKSPELDIVSEIEGEIFSENEDFNRILVKSTMKDKDIGDLLKIRYSLSKDGHDVEGYKEIQLGEDIIANGNLQDFEESIEITSSFPEGKLELNLWVEDNRGGKSKVQTYSIAVDKIAPITPDPIVTVDSESQITIKALPSDELAGIHQEYILWSKDNVDLGSWTDVNLLIDDNLTPNQMYSYKYKAKDAVDNISENSNEISNYTLALNPIKVILKEVTGTSITLDVKNNTENINIPETIIELKEKGGNTTVSSSNWGIDTTKTLTGLIPGKEYDVYINTRNGDKVENGSIKIPNPDISFEDEFGNPIITITTVIPVENYNISGSSVNALSVSWDQALNQEYQVFLKDEFNNEIAESRSLWIKNNQYTFDNLPLPNTKYVPYITTRRVSSTSSLTPTKVLNEEKAYTNAEGISKGTFESGEDFIEVTLILDSLKNPTDTEYELKNDVTGQLTKVLHSNPIWKNTNLAKESYYTYSVRAINKNGEPSYFTKLVFINGEDPHTYIPDLDIGDDIIDKPGGDIIDLDELEDWDSDKPIWFNPEDLDGKEVKIDDEVFIVTKNKMETIKNKEKIEVANYAFSKEGFGFTDWKELKEGFFEDKIYFNQPGYYKTHFKFKNHVRESKPLILNYIADWIAPDIIAENKIKGQSVVTGNDFEIRLNVEDNISKFLFYSIDDGTTYYHLKDGNSDVIFTDIEKTTSGVQNRLKIKVADICGNIKEESFTIWGVNK